MHPNREPNKRWRSVALAALLALAARSAQASAGIAGHYALRNLDGHAVTEQAFKGKWQLIYFGFTTCATICSAVLAEINGALGELGPRSARLQPVFITLDPERDSAGQLRSYLAHFDPRIVGLRGTREETQAAASSFRVYYKTLPLKPGSSTYTIEHSSFLFLLRPDGGFSRLLQANGSGHALADELRGVFQ